MIKKMEQFLLSKIQNPGTMKRFISFFLLLVFLFLSCEKDNFDSVYPTTIKIVPMEIISHQRASFSSRNIYMITSLNEFGFCGYSGDLLSAESPPAGDSLTEAEARETATNFIAVNSSATGVSVPKDMGFTQILPASGFNGTSGWYLRSSSQKVDTIEVLYTDILFHITNREVTFCIGNWFPDVYIPKEFNINKEKAKTYLLNKVVSHSNIAGQPYYVTITAADINNSTIGLKILPVTDSDKIELRVCWLFNIPGPVFYKIYIDVMTGEIEGQEPAIFS